MQTDHLRETAARPSVPAADDTKQIQHALLTGDRALLQLQAKRFESQPEQRNAWIRTVQLAAHTRTFIDSEAHDTTIQLLSWPVLIACANCLVPAVMKLGSSRAGPMLALMHNWWKTAYRHTGAYTLLPFLGVPLLATAADTSPFRLQGRLWEAEQAMLRSESVGHDLAWHRSPGQATLSTEAGGVMFLMSALAVWHRNEAFDLAPTVDGELRHRVASAFAAAVATSARAPLFRAVAADPAPHYTAVNMAMCMQIRHCIGWMGDRGLEVSPSIEQATPFQGRSRLTLENHAAGRRTTPAWLYDPSTTTNDQDEQLVDATTTRPRIARLVSARDLRTLVPRLPRHAH